MTNESGNRIARHPILGDAAPQRAITLYFEGKAIPAQEGEPIMAALVAAGVSVFRYTKKGAPRRMFCGIGRCTDCVMIVDGIPGVRTCVTAALDGMKVERQEGAGRWIVEEERSNG
jgi:predicted molibdopterin-dependent oxidoreductase YjgC